MFYLFVGLRLFEGCLSFLGTPLVERKSWTKKKYIKIVVYKLKGRGNHILGPQSLYVCVRIKYIYIYSIVCTIII